MQVSKKQLLRIIREELLRHEKKVLRETVASILSEGIYDQGILKAVFMAGGPGSGKSFTAKALFGGNKASELASSTTSGLKILNSDPAFEKYLDDVGVDPGDLADIAANDPELAYELGLDDDRGVPPGSPRGKAKSFKKTAQRMWTRDDARLGIIVDGTGDDLEKITGKKAAMEELGYDTYMVFVNTTLEVAQERNMKRKRKLPPPKVDEIWTDVQANLGAFQGLFGQGNITIVDNTVYGPLPEDVVDAITDFLARPIRNPIGRQWIEDQLSTRGGGTKKERSRLLGQQTARNRGEQ